jgi:enoyl-CoA hydratase/carnithine racemase
MDGFQVGASPEHDRRPGPVFQTIPAPLRPADRLIERQLPGLETLVITKTVAGFDAACVDSLRRTVRDAAAGRLGPLKFLVLDFAHHDDGESIGGAGFGALVNEVANLILRAAVVSIASVRADMIGADLEFALACNMIVSEPERRFSFAADPIVSLATYGFLSQKIGFVRAERLMERGEVIDAGQMHELMLVKRVMESGAGLAGIEEFLIRTGRRYNACYGIYRAQRMASPALAGDLDDAFSA